MNIYVSRFLRSFTCENVISLFSRYNRVEKEISESWAMLEAAKRFCQDVNNCLVIVIGDGASPRTGAIFAYYSRADVISVDPGFNMSHWLEHFQKQTLMGFTPQRLRVVPKKIEDEPIDCCGKPCIVIWPHSHAKMGTEKISGYSSRMDIAMPCCVPIPSRWMQKEHIVFDDVCVLSPKRTIHVWRD